MVTWSGVAAAAASDEEEVCIKLVLGLFARSALRCGYGARWRRSEVSFADLRLAGSGSISPLSSLSVERESCGGQNTRLEVPDTDQNLRPVPVDTRIPTQDKERNKAYTRIPTRMIIGLGTIPEINTEMPKFEGAYPNTYPRPKISSVANPAGKADSSLSFLIKWRPLCSSLLSVAHPNITLLK
jgi:hypothetical protein